MSAVGNLVRKLPLVAAAGVSAGVGGMLFQIVVSRQLAPEVFGSYVAISTLLYALCQVFESNSYAVAKEIASGEHPEFRQTAGLTVGLGLGCSVLAFVAHTISSGGSVNWPLWATCGLALVVWALLWLLRGVAQGIQLESAFVTNRAVELLGRLAIGLGVLALFSNLTAAIVASVVGAGIAIGHLVWALRGKLAWAPIAGERWPRKAQVQQFFKMAAAFLPMALYMRLDTILAPRHFVAEDLGAFGVLSTVGKAVLIYSLALSPLVFPYVVKSKGERDWAKLLLLSIGASISFLLVIFGLLVWLGPAAVESTFGVGYTSAWPLLPGYVLAMIPIAILCSIINLLLARVSLRTVGLLWMGICGYGAVLSYIPHSMSTYIETVAIGNSVLSVAALVVAWRTFRMAVPKSVDHASEARIRFADPCGNGMEGVDSRLPALQIQGDRHPIA